MKIKQEMLLIPAQSVMNGFCYAYSKALLEKLKELRAEERLFDHYDNLTEIARVVISSLEHQTKIASSINVEGIRSFIDVVDEFLAIFEKK